MLGLGTMACAMAVWGRVCPYDLHCLLGFLTHDWRAVGFALHTPFAVEF